MTPPLEDFHVHTTFCDGKNTAEEMVLAAIDRGLTRLGFSGHAHMPFDDGCAMSPEATDAYRREVSRLREEYRDRIEIFCGIEQDFFSDVTAEGYDYVIGSVHSLRIGGEYLSVDESGETFRRAVSEHFDGDALSFAEEYFRLAAQVVERTGADLIGHFDLVTKFNEGGCFFDENHPRYIAASNAALDALLRTGRPFEINTGAVSRGYRRSPYPGLRILRRIAERGGRVILSSDSHRSDTLCFQFAEAQALAESVGLKVERFQAGK